jgi:hypothetical protein
MKKSNTVAWIVGVVIVIALIGWAITRLSNPSPISVGDNNATGTPATSSSTSPNTSGTPGSGTTQPVNLGETYSNSTYGFSISYPRELNAQPFDNFHQLNQNDWRYAATAVKRGTPVISIPVIEFDRGNGIATNQPYPLFYTAQVRVGVSTDVANCYAKDDGYTNQTVSSVAVGGVTWKKFIFGDAATMKYVNGASYRTVHNNKCYVIEQIENGTNYRDDTMKSGYTDAELKAIYAKTTPIVTSFRFTK